MLMFAALHNDLNDEISLISAIQKGPLKALKSSSTAGEREEGFPVKLQ